MARSTHDEQEKPPAGGAAGIDVPPPPPRFLGQRWRFFRETADRDQRFGLLAYGVRLPPQH